MKALKRFLRRLWFLGSGADPAAGGRGADVDRHGPVRRGQDWV
jgi:hypothetical protein